MRTFANPSGITCAVGNAGVLAGAFTMAAIIRRTSDNDAHVLISLMASTNHRGGLWVSNGGGSGGSLQVVSSGFDTTFGITVPNSVPVFVAVTKDDGDGITPHGWMYRYDTDAWTDADGVGTVNEDSTAITSVTLGQHSSDWYFIGDYGIGAVWNSILPPALLQALPFALQAWYGSAPRAGWLFDQSDVAQQVIDFTGGGANQTARTNTTVSTFSLPVFSYGLAPLVPHSVPAAGGTTFTVDLVGAVTPAGALIRSISKPLAGATTPTGLLIRQVSKALAGSTTPAGVLTRQPGKLLAGAVTPAGALVRAPGKALAGSVTPTGLLIRSTSKTLTGATTPAGAVVKQTSRTLTGSVTPTGAVANIRALLLSFAGSITPTGTLTRQPGKTLGGTVTPTGATTKLISKSLTGGTTPAGALLKLVGKLLGGSTTPAGAVANTIQGASAGSAHHATRTAAGAGHTTRTAGGATHRTGSGPTVTGR